LFFTDKNDLSDLFATGKPYFVFSARGRAAFWQLKIFFQGEQVALLLLPYIPDRT